MKRPTWKRFTHCGALHPAWGCVTARTPRPRGTGQARSRSGAARASLPPGPSGHGFPTAAPLDSYIPARPQGPRPRTGPPSAARPALGPSPAPGEAAPPAAALSGCEMAAGGARAPAPSLSGLRTLGPAASQTRPTRGSPPVLPRGLESRARRASDWAGPEPGAGPGGGWSGGLVRSEAPPTGRAARAQRSCLDSQGRRWGRGR